VDPEQLKSGLAAFLVRSLNARSVEIRGLRRLTGGASREIWSLDAVIEQEDGSTSTRPLVMRSDPGRGPKSLERSVEYLLLKAAHERGVAVPEVLLPGDDSLGTPFFLMERVEGETIPRRLLRDDIYSQARAVMTGQLGAALARIHRIPIDEYGLDVLPAPAAGRSPAEEELGRFEQAYRIIAVEPHPAFELAFRWLRERLPRGSERALVHGDYRMGNVICGPEGVRAILDWELAHIGDPMEDLGWISVRSWRFGNDHLPVGGVGTRDEFFKAYEEAGGFPVDEARVRFWEAFGNLRWGIICLSQARTYFDGHSPSVDLASIGRRTAETEWELLGLMEGA
jgi:aminoglycoside phosphotransferase (APT) family kinase protein